MGSAAFIAIEDEIFPHSHLINPAHPILGQFRHLSQILIPRAGNSFMPLLQLFVPYISLKIKDTEITAAFPTKIVLYYGSIFLTGPAGGIIVSPRPIQPVQFGVPPFFLNGRKSETGALSVKEHFISRIVAIQPQMFRQIKAALRMPS